MTNITLTPEEPSPVIRDQVILLFTYADFAFSDYLRPYLLMETVGVSHLIQD